MEDTKEGETPVEVHFTVNKTDAGNGEEVEGAELQLIEVAEDGTETVYDSWTSKAGETHDFGDKMKAGKTYVLRETVAPAGHGKVTTETWTESDGTTARGPEGYTTITYSYEKNETTEKYFDDFFPESYLATIGIEFKTKKIKFNDYLIDLNIWDTTGQ